MPHCQMHREKVLLHASHYLPGHRDLLSEGAGTSWDPSHKGSEEANDDYFSLLRDCRRVAEVGCFTALCERDQM